MEVIVGLTFIAAIGYVMVRKFNKVNKNEKDCCK